MHVVTGLIVREMALDETGHVIFPGKVHLLKADDVGVCRLDEIHDRVHAGFMTAGLLELGFPPHYEASHVVGDDLYGLSARVGP